MCGDAINFPVTGVIVGGFSDESDNHIVYHDVLCTLRDLIACSITQLGNGCLNNLYLNVWSDLRLLLLCYILLNGVT